MNYNINVLINIRILIIIIIIVVVGAFSDVEKTFYFLIWQLKPLDRRIKKTFQRQRLGLAAR